jgi:phosphomethylpyrimidine synthase
MTLIEEARQGVINDKMRRVADDEGLSAEYIRQGVADGNIVILNNNRRKNLTPLGVGKGLRTKINANIGTSREQMSLELELDKLRAAVNAGADTIMDLSTGGNVDRIRRMIIEECHVPLGTVPIYQAALDAMEMKKSLVEMSVDELFRVIEKQGQQGVDFITVHCGVTREHIRRMREEGRLMDVVSRGGAFTVEWMRYNEQENPLLEHYDRLLNIAYEYDMTLSLGDGLRPGAIADATDRGQVLELVTLGELTERAWERGVQVMIEGPGHVPLDQIEANITLQKRLCHGAPFYVLGPLVTDLAPGYDHITSAIGGAIAAKAGADYLCYVTPSEHIRLPSVEDVKEGVIACKIAAHAADIAKGVKGAMEKDVQMSRYRKSLDWEGMINMSLDPERARAMRESSMPSEEEDVCTMCGTFCAIKVANK